MTIAQAFNEIAVAQGGTANNSGTIAGAIDALNDALAGSDQEAAQTIEEAVRLLGSHIGGGASVTVEALTATENKTYTAPEGKAYSPVTVNVSGGGSSIIETMDVWNMSDESQDGIPDNIPTTIKYPSGFENNELVYTEPDFETITKTEDETTIYGVRISDVPIGCVLNFEYDESIWYDYEFADNVANVVPMLIAGYDANYYYYAYRVL